MSAELEHLIAVYRVRGLTQAAEHLTVAKAGLEAMAYLPPQLAADAGDMRPLEAPLHQLIITEFGTAEWRRGPLDVRKPHELDALHLAPRQRNALIRSGFSTLADVRYGVEHHMLPLVRGISKKGAHAIAERIGGSSGRRGSAAP